MSVNFTKIYGHIYPIDGAKYHEYDQFLRKGMYVAKHRVEELSLEKNRFLLNFKNLFPEFETIEQAVSKIHGLKESLEREKKRRSNRNSYNYHNNPEYFLMELIDSANYHEYSPYREFDVKKPKVNIESRFERLKKIDGRLNVIFENDVVYVVSNTSDFQKGFILVKDKLHLIGRYESVNNKYFERLSTNEIHLLLQGESPEVVKEKKLTLQDDKFNQLNIGEINQLKQDTENQLSGYAKEIEKIENFETEELMPLKLEMEKIKLEMERQAEKQRSLIEKKKAEFELMKAEMEKKIFFLTVDLNALMYYLGEKLTMIQVRKGKNAPINQPIVAYQKLRYLDIEMARYTGSKGITWKSTSSFEEIIKYRDDLLGMFNQSDKSISFFKLSKTGFQTEYSHKRINLLCEYELDHGSELGFMIRDGENVLIGWLNDEDITLAENVFLSYKNTIIEEKAENKSDFFSKREEEKEKKKEQKEMSSRYIIFHLLQGLIDGENGFFELEKRPNVFLESSNSNLIVFSLADGWIEDKRFGDYKDVMGKYAPLFDDEKIIPMQGEKIITTQAISGTSWSNDDQSYRSVGYNDRVHDVRVKDKEVYSINKIKKEDRPYYSHIYISEEKEWSRERFEFQDIYRSSYEPKMTRIARANIRLENDEYVRLTFLNTVLIEYLLNLKETDKFEKNYTYMAGYYNKMLNYLREREEIELSLIKKHFEGIEDVFEWQVILSDWKLEKVVRGDFTDYQAKRFVNYLKENSFIKE